MRKTIVVVEDNQLIAGVYRAKLQAEGFRVEVAADGQAGLEMIRRTRPDLVLLDLLLPKITGIELLTKLRAQPDSQQLPVVVFSSSYVSDDAWKAGATQVLNKATHSPKQVVEEVNNLLAASFASAQTASASAAANAPAPPPQTAFAASASADADLQIDLRKTFRDDLPETIIALRSSLRAFIGNPIDKVNLYDLYRKVHAVSGNAGLSGFTSIAEFASALESLLKELSDNPKQNGVSALYTAARAVEFLARLLTHDAERPAGATTAATILVVDDEEIARRAVSHALEKADLRPLRIAESSTALSVLRENRFDLLFVDIEMPEMTGLELCAKLRAMPSHEKTPIVFMTTAAQFERYKQPVSSAGDDLIAKPFHHTEVAVKALTSLFRSRLKQ